MTCGPLIDAGTALIAEGGLPALSVAEAVRRTGVSAAAPYRHFPNRQDFVIAVAAKAARELDAAMREAADAVDDPVEAIRPRPCVRRILLPPVGPDST